MIEMTDADLFARLRNFEDAFVERKTVADLNDSLKVVVSFANSAPFGMPCILYIGVRDNGAFEDKVHDFDGVQKTLNKKLQAIYPRVPYFPKIIWDGEKQALAVIVYGSELRPHFAGLSYVRVGSESVEASQAQFDNLVAQRNSKVYRLSQHIGQPVGVQIRWIMGNNTFTTTTMGAGTLLLDCNESWITIGGPGVSTSCFPLGAIELSGEGGESKRLLILATRYHPN